MHLSTFNSRNVNIAVTLLMALAMMVTYDCLIRSGLIPEGSGSSMQKANCAKAEAMCLSPGSPEVVAVGSSILCCVLDAAPDSKICNFCFQGGSALDGVGILQATNKKPRLLLVEVQSSGAGAQESLQHEVLSAHRQWLIRFSPVFRTAYSPSSVLMTVLKSLSGRDRQPKRNVAALNLLTETRDDLPSAEKLKANSLFLQRLKTAINQLRHQGVRVFFVEVPQDKLFCAGKRILSLRKMAHEAFPEPEYCWIATREKRDWLTTDGVHLDRQDAAIFASEITKRIQQLGSTRQGGS
jgi:hypothetical protein